VLLHCLAIAVAKPDRQSCLVEASARKEPSFVDGSSWCLPTSRVVTAAPWVVADGIVAV
jgi:hypothetical protein